LSTETVGISIISCEDEDFKAGGANITMMKLFSPGIETVLLKKRVEKSSP
jgi:hypothetical protein